MDLTREDTWQRLCLEMCAIVSDNEVPVECSVAKLLSDTMRRAARAEAALHQYKLEVETRTRIEIEQEQRRLARL